MSSDWNIIICSKWNLEDIFYGLSFITFFLNRRGYNMLFFSDIMAIYSDIINVMGQNWFYSWIFLLCDHILCPGKSVKLILWNKSTKYLDGIGYTLTLYTTAGKLGKLWRTYAPYNMIYIIIFNILKDLLLKDVKIKNKKEQCAGWIISISWAMQWTWACGEGRHWLTLYGTFSLIVCIVVIRTWSLGKPWR